MTAVPAADERVGNGLLRTLSRAAADGHCFLPEPRLVVAARQVVDADAITIRSGLDTLVAAKAVVREDVPGTDPDGRPVTVRAVYLAALHRAEISLANGLLRLLHATSRRLDLAGADWDRALSWYAARSGTTLSADQREAVRQPFTSPLSVLAAGPGHTLPETLSAITALATARKARVLLVTPNDDHVHQLDGSVEVATVGGLLGLRPGGGAAHDRERPLGADLVIVTEVSTMDIRVADRLVRAVPNGAHLVLVGDPDRRPSLGPGQVLRDLLAAGAVPGAVLGEPARQAARNGRSGTGDERSGLVENAYRVRRGEVPRTRGLADFFLFAAEEVERVVELTVEVAARRVPARFGVDPVRDVQVETAGTDGPAGAVALDAALRQVLGPARDALTSGAVRDGRDGPTGGVARPGGYAVPVGQAQGGTFPVVVVPVVPGGGLDREGLYTAVTRAGRAVVLVGSRAALAEAVAADERPVRHTMLTHRLGG
jgi:exodeoxyribonuclease V alpha subunit